MKERLSLSVDADTAAYLARHAAKESAGNVSAYVDKLVRNVRLAEAVAAEARWYREHPDYATDAEDERNAAA